MSGRYTIVIIDIKLKGHGDPFPVNYNYIALVHFWQKNVEYSLKNLGWLLKH